VSSASGAGSGASEGIFWDPEQITGRQQNPRAPKQALDLAAISLDIDGEADAPSALDPVANDLVAVEKRQDKQ
jgi:hypothetical protein